MPHARRGHPCATHLGDVFLADPVEAEMAEVERPAAGPRSPRDDEVGDLWGWKQSLRAGTEGRGPPSPAPWHPRLGTSWPWQAAVAQGKAVVAGPQGAALQGNPQLAHAGEGPVPALQRDSPSLQLDGELP